MPKEELPPLPEKRRRGRPFKTHCLRGHDLSVHRRRGTRSYYCGECQKTRDCPSWRPSKKRDYELQRKYGITLEQMKSMLESQGGLCAACGTAGFGIRGPVVDHCHQTGTVRGILCTPCNTSIGLCGDSPDILRAVARYLESSQPNP